MRKIVARVSALGIVASNILLVLAAPSRALAQNSVGINCQSIEQGSSGINPLCYVNPSTLLSTIVIIAFIAAALLAFLFLIIGGIRWILSGGNKEGTTAARGMITAAIIGLAIVFLSFVVINILGVIFGFNITNLQIPSLANLDQPTP